MKAIRYRTIVAATASTLMLVVVGCGAPPSTAHTTHVTKAIPVTIAWQPSADVAVLVAQKEGLFKKYGLDVTLKKFITGPAMFAAAKGGSVDIIGTATTAFLGAVSSGVPVLGIAIGNDDAPNNTLVVQPSSGISSVAQLKGHSVAAPLGTAVYFALAKALAANGLSMTSITYKNLSPATIIPAFEAKSIDATWIWTPWSEILRSKGGKAVVDSAEIGIHSPDIWGATTAWLGEYPQGAERFAAAVNAATVEMLQKPELIYAALQANFGVSLTVAREIANTDKYPTAKELVNPSYYASISDWPSATQGLGAILTSTGKLLVKEGIISKMPPLAAVFTATPVKQVAG